LPAALWKISSARQDLTGPPTGPLLSPAKKKTGMTLTYKVQVRTPNGLILWVKIQARSMYEAEQLGRAYGQVLQAVLDMGH
jgi:hypothetical protein